jgi:hypothetical protein
MHSIARSARAADGASRTVERGKKTVAGGVDLGPTPVAQLISHDHVVSREQFAPALVTQLCCALGRSDDVGEENSGEDSVRIRAPAHACEEPFDLVQDPVLITDPGEVILPRQLDELCATNPVRHVPGTVDGQRLIAEAVEDQRGYTDGW